MVDGDRIWSLGHLRINNFELVSRETDGLDRSFRCLVFVDVEAVVGMGDTPVPRPRLGHELDLNVTTVLWILEARSWYIADEIGIFQFFALPLQRVLTLFNVV